MTSKVIQTIIGNNVHYKVIKDGYKTITETIHITDDMPTRTTYDLSPSTVVHDPELDYTVDTSHEYPPVITFNENVVTPDNTEIKTNKYVLSTYGQEYLLLDGQQDDNFSRIGNIQVNKDGTASGFSTINCIRLLEAFNPGNNPWEIVFKIKTSGDVTTNQSIFGNYGASYQNSPQININESHFSIYIPTNPISSSFLINKTGTYTIMPNTSYWLKLFFNGASYSLDYSLDGLLFINDITESSSVAIGVANEGFYIGYNYYKSDSTQYFQGSIDLSESYIKINDEIWWQPIWNKLAENYYKVGRLYDNNGIISNFNSGDTNNRNYIKIPSFQPGSQPWEIKTRIYLTDRSNDKRILGTVSTETNNPVIGIGTDGKFYVYLSANGSSWNITSNSKSTSAVSLNTWHTIRILWSGTQYRILVDGTQYWSINSTTPIYRNYDPLCLGGTLNLSSFAGGKIDLKNTLIYINNKQVWEYRVLNILNAEVYGSPVILNNNIVSNFTTSSYLRMPTMFNPGNDSWEMCFKFKQDSLNTTWRALFGSYSGDYTCGAHLYVTQNGCISFELTSANGSWDITGVGGKTSGVIFTAAKWYWVKLEFTGTYYNAYLSEDGSNFTKIIEFANSTPIRASQKQTIGCDQYAGGDHYLNGSIDLSESYIKINNNIWWTGNTNIAEYAPGILDSNYIDTGDQVTLNLYDVETDQRTLILNNNRDVTVSNKQYVEYNGEIEIPEHGLSIYDSETYSWSKYRIITLNVNDEDTGIYTEGNI